MSFDQSGDFVTLCADPSSSLVSKIIYGTVFNIRRAYSNPEIEFAIQQCKLSPPQPVAIGPSSIMGSWLNFKASMTGDQLDMICTSHFTSFDLLLKDIPIVGGPNRPVPVRMDAAQSTRSGSGSGVYGSAATAASSVAASAASAQATIYSKLSSALGERGQLLNGLEEGFKSLEQGSQNMAAQVPFPSSISFSDTDHGMKAKKLAAQQTAKSWFGF